MLHFLEVNVGCVEIVEWKNSQLFEKNIRDSDLAKLDSSELIKTLSGYTQPYQSS